MARVGIRRFPHPATSFSAGALRAGYLKGKNPMSSPTDNPNHAAEAQVPDFEFHYSPAQFRLLEGFIRLQRALEMRQHRQRHQPQAQ